MPFFSGSLSALCLDAPVVRFKANVLNTGGREVDFLPDLSALPKAPS